MWKKIKNSNFFISHSNEYELYLTDYVSLWFVHFSETSFLHCLKDSNKLLEMSNVALLEKGLSLLSNPEKLKSFDTTLEGTSLIINMIMDFGYAFKLNLKLNKGSNELFFRKITQPLLKTAMELKNSQYELCQLLNKKDSEIEEYKSEGGEIALKHLKTIPFNEGEVLNKYKSFQEQFGSRNDLLTDLIETVVDAPEDNVKQEEPDKSTVPDPPKIKLEHKDTRLHILPVKVQSSSGSSNVKLEPNTAHMVKAETNMSCKVEPEGDPSDRDANGINSTFRILEGGQVPSLVNEVFPDKRKMPTLPASRNKMKRGLF